MPDLLHRPTHDPTSGGPAPVSTSSGAVETSVSNSAQADRLSLDRVETTGGSTSSRMNGELDWLRNWLEAGPQSPDSLSSGSLTVPGAELKGSASGQAGTAQGTVTGSVNADSNGLSGQASANGQVGTDQGRLHGSASTRVSEHGISGSGQVGIDVANDNGLSAGINAQGTASSSGHTSGSVSMRAGHSGTTNGVDHRLGLTKTVGEEGWGTATASARHGGETAGVGHTVDARARLDDGELEGSVRGSVSKKAQLGDATVDGSLTGLIDSEDGVSASGRVGIGNGTTRGAVTADTKGKVTASLRSKASTSIAEGTNYRLGAAEAGGGLTAKRDKDSTELGANLNAAVIAAEARLKGSHDVAKLEELAATVDGRARAAIEARADANALAKTDTAGASAKGTLKAFAGAKAEASLGGTLNWDRGDYTQDLVDIADILPGNWDDRMLDRIPDDVWERAAKILFGTGRTPLARASVAVDARAGAGADAHAELKTTHGGLMETDLGAGAAMGVGGGFRTKIGLNPLDLLRKGIVDSMQNANHLIGSVEAALRQR